MEELKYLDLHLILIPFPVTVLFKLQWMLFKTIFFLLHFDVGSFGFECFNSILPSVNTQINIMPTNGSIVSDYVFFKLQLNVVFPPVR